MAGFNKFRLAIALAISAVVVSPAIMAGEYSLEECQRMASEGNAEAQWQLGQRYESGDGVKKNPLRAIAQYKKAADQRHNKACVRLAYLYESGMFVKKDPLQAAKYKAWAEGENEKSAIEKAQSMVDKAKEDEIEIALDYILGRKGKTKDVRTGIRILYEAAKDKPIAQSVFVVRWGKGDLDDALDELSEEEWQKILPWFRNAWNRGNKRTGLVLGNDAYARKEYSLAVKYWKESELAKAWYFVGKFYDPALDEKSGGGPTNMRDETKARKAYEKCLKLDRNFDSAKLFLGCLYLFAEKKGNCNFYEAKRIFEYFLRIDANDKWYNYDYGLAGFCLLNEQFNEKWPQADCDTLIAWEKEYANGRQYANGSMSSYDRRMLAKYNLYSQDLENLAKSLKEYVQYIKKAADMGCEPAENFIKNLQSGGQ